MDYAIHEEGNCTGIVQKLRVFVSGKWQVLEIMVG